MKKKTFEEYCTKCNSINVFIKIDNKEFCSDVHLFGISFIGGARFYTFREIFKTLGLKKKLLYVNVKRVIQRRYNVLTVVNYLVHIKVKKKNVIIAIKLFMFVSDSFCLS